jgi:hypothetical protein
MVGGTSTCSPLGAPAFAILWSMHTVRQEREQVDAITSEPIFVRSHVALFSQLWKPGLRNTWLTEPRAARITAEHVVLDHVALVAVP